MIRVLFLGALITFLLPTLGWAQTSAIPGLVRTPTITLSPEYPAPFETVTARVSMSGEDMTSAEIAWVLDGKPVAEGVGRDTYTWSVGDIGETQTLAVIMRTAQGETTGTQARITPVRVSVAWEAQTYTPPLYKGRALFSAGSRVVVETAVEALDAQKKRTDPGTLVYTWRRNGSVIPDTQGRGRHTITIEGPKFYSTDIVSVEVRTQNGVMLGTGAVQIETKDPLLVLYTWNPLTGVSYHHAIEDSAGSAGTAQTVVAEPFFVGARSPRDPVLLYEWRINGSAITTDATRPEYLSLSSEDALNATLSLSVTHQNALLQEARHTWRLRFTEERGFGLFGL